MSETGHDLHNLFPNDRDALHALKVENGHYRSLAERHHHLAQEIGRIEGGLEAASDPWLEELKKQRLGIVDEIAVLIAARRVET